MAVAAVCVDSAPVGTEGEAALAAAADTGCSACLVSEEAADEAGICPPGVLGVADEGDGEGGAGAVAVGPGEVAASVVLAGDAGVGAGVVSAAGAGGVEAGSAGEGAGGSAAGGAEAVEGGMGARPPSGRQRRPRGSE